MLIPLSEGLSADERLLYALLRPEWVAFCPESGARLTVSLGNPRAGRSRRYRLTVPRQAPVRWNTPCPRVADDIRVFRAASSLEAIVKGNALLSYILDARSPVAPCADCSNRLTSDPEYPVPSEARG